MPNRQPSSLEPGVVAWAAGWDVLFGGLPEEVDSRALAARAADALERSAPRNSHAARAVYGVTAALALPYAAWTGTKIVLGVTARIHGAVFRELATVLMKGALSIRGTADSLRETEEIIRARSTAEGRRQADAASRLTAEGGPSVDEMSLTTPMLASEGQMASGALRKLAESLADPPDTAAARGA